MWLSVIPALLGVIVSINMIEPKVHKKGVTNIYSHVKEALSLFQKNYQLRTLSILNIINFARGEAGHQFTAAFYNTLWPVWAIGIAKMLSNIGAVIGFHFSGRIIKKYKPLPVLIIGKIYSLVSIIMATAYLTAFSPILMSSNSVFFGTGSVAMGSLLQKEYSNEQRSTMRSLNSLIGSIAFAVVSFGLGLFADKMGPAKALLWLQVLSGVSLYLLWRLFPKKSGS